MTPNDARVAHVREVLTPKGGRFGRRETSQTRPGRHRSEAAVTARWLRTLRSVSDPRAATPS